VYHKLNKLNHEDSIKHLKLLVNRTPKLNYTVSTQHLELKLLEIITNVETSYSSLNNNKRHKYTNQNISKTMLDSKYLPLQMCKEVGLDDRIINLILSQEHEITKSSTTNSELNSLNEFIKDSSNTVKTQRILLKNTVLHNQTVKSMN